MVFEKYEECFLKTNLKIIEFRFKRLEDLPKWLNYNCLFIKMIGCLKSKISIVHYFVEISSTSWSLWDFLRFFAPFGHFESFNFQNFWLAIGSKFTPVVRNLQWLSNSLRGRNGKYLSILLDARLLFQVNGGLNRNIVKITREKFKSRTDFVIVAIIEASHID